MENAYETYHYDGIALLVKFPPRVQDIPIVRSSNQGVSFNLLVLLNRRDYRIFKFFEFSKRIEDCSNLIFSNPQTCKDLNRIEFKIFNFSSKGKKSF